MGEVFAAENIRTGRPVAVKLLRAESKQKSSAVARFRREARAAGSINSDFVTEILDVEEDDEFGICLVFELLEGESLIDRLKRTGPIDFDELHPIIEQVWRGLADAHNVGIIHRDLKPSNVFLEKRPDGTTRVKILDFGISKLPKEMGGETLTEMGQSLGTFSFMPPEQIGKAKTVDHRADIYAAATLIYQAMSGQLPYAARNILVMVEMKSKTEPRRLSEVMTEPIDPRLEEFLAHALARDPAARFQTAMEALERWRELRRPAREPSSPAFRMSERGLPLISDPTSDSTADNAATIAIPVRQFQRGQRQNAPAGAGLHQPARQNFQHTVPVQQMMAHRPESQNAGDGSNPRLSGTMAMRPAAGQPLPDPRPPGHNTSQSSPSLPRMSTGPEAMLENTGADDPDMPASQERTRLYRAPSHSVDPRAISQSGPSPMQMDSESSASNKRSAVPFVLGALVFAMVGFGVVAVVLQYMRTGTFPWQ